MTREDYISNIESILKYGGSYSTAEMAALIIASDKARTQAAYGEHPAELDNSNVQKIASFLTSVIPGPSNEGNAKFSHEIIADFIRFLKGGDVSTQDKLLIQECIRITPIDEYKNDPKEAGYIINNPTIYVGEGMEMEDASEEFTLKKAVSLSCHDKFSKITDVPTKLNPRCSIIEILKPSLGTTSRDTKEVSIFTNMVTSLEMSRCVPFMRVRIIPPKYVDNQGLPVRMPAFFNIIGFLKGDKVPLDTKNLSSSDAALSMTMGPDGVSIDGGGSMELFTSPQTMMTPRGNLGNFSNKILDRSRPFMTITNVKMSVKPVAGWYSYKTATIDLVLHDRSRLGEIAPFIKPDIFAGANRTTFEIEYGWSHPDGNKKIGDRIKNPIGTFLNGLRCLENYEVYNATYSFAEAGQVNISLQLTMKSHSSILAKTPTITELKPKIEAIESLTKDINAKMKAVTGNDAARSKSLSEVFPEILMGGVASADAAMSMDLTKFDELQSKMNDIVAMSQGQTKEISKAISELLTKTNDAQKNASTVANEKVNSLISGIEIFPVNVNDNIARPSTRVTIPTTLSPATKSTISLGRILYAYVAAPLAATNEFAEVQLIFGLHNDRASFMRSLSIARHPIDSEVFQKEITEFMKKQANMTINEFIDMMNEKFISNTAAFAHGFSNAQPPKSKNGEQTKEDIKNIDLKSKIITDDARIKDGNYRPPNLQITTECVKSKNGELILRIFVFDAIATVHQTYVDLMRAARDVSSNVINLAAIDPEHPLIPNAPEVRNLGKSKEALIEYLTKKGAIKGASTEAKASPSSSDEAVKVSAMALVEDASKLKSVISKGLPYIRYGQGGGAITSIGASSLSDPALANAALSTAGQGTAYAASNADQYRGIPMRIAPADLSLELLGCPLLSIGQNFFIDLDTQTTLDGIYTISGVEHSFSPGSFNSSVKLINTSDGYMSFRSSGNELSSTISRWLQEDPDAKAAAQAAEDKRKADEERRTSRQSSGRATGDSKATDLTQSEYDKAVSSRAADLRNSAEMPLTQDLYKKVETWGLTLTKGEGKLIESKFVDVLQSLNGGRALTDKNGNLYKFTRRAPLGAFCWYVRIQYGVEMSMRSEKQFDAYGFVDWLARSYVNFLKQQRFTISTEDASTIESGIKNGSLVDMLYILSALQTVHENDMSSKFLEQAKKEIDEKMKKK